MSNLLFSLLILSSIMLSTLGALRNYDYDECFYLSKKKCKQSSYCYYDRFSGFCFEYDDSHHEDCNSLSKRKCLQANECSYDYFKKTCFESNKDGKDLDGDDSGGMTPIEPPVEYAPETPDGWDEMMRRDKKQSRRMFIACACLFPLPKWFNEAGGFFCWCV